MTITALAGTEQPTRVIQRPRLLARVMAWEFHRFRASRLFWLQALGFFCFSFFLTWVQRAPYNFSQVNGKTGVLLSGSVAGTSAEGLLHTLPTSLVVLVLFLPFVTVDGVTRDLQRRTHELLLTTALPTRAYVWGRYLMGLGMSLGLAVLFLVATLGMGELLHLTVTDYPAPEIGTTLLLWVGIVLSATILVSSLGFALGTLLPRLSMLIKVVILVAWIVGGVVMPLGLGGATPPSWYVNWDPTSGITGYGLRLSYSLNIGPSITSEAQLQQFLVSAENKMADLAGWFVPHLLLAGVSLALVLVASLAFKRSCEALN
jgi:ABC-type transport system involved in multi-copper enzyme maturation permease subunit